MHERKQKTRRDTAHRQELAQLSAHSNTDSYHCRGNRNGNHSRARQYDVNPHGAHGVFKLLTKQGPPAPDGRSRSSLSGMLLMPVSDRLELRAEQTNSNAHDRADRTCMNRSGGDTAKIQRRLISAAAALVAIWLLSLFSFIFTYNKKETLEPCHI